MTQNDRIFDFQVIEDRNGIVAKHPGRVIDGRFARPSRPPIVMGDHPVVFRELGNLEEFPNLTVAGRLTEKDKRLSFAVDVIIDFTVVDFYCRHATLRYLVFDELANDPVGFARVREEVTMALIRQYDELGIWNALGQDFRRHPMIDFTRHVPVAVADEHQRRLLDVLQPLAGIVTLARDQMAQVEFHRAEVVHSDFQVVIDFFRIVLNVFFRPTDQNRMLPFVFLVTPFDHFFADL